LFNALQLGLINLYFHVHICWQLMSFRLRLDVDIGALGIELVSMPNQTSIDIGLQYQSHCLDADEIARWNQGASEYRFVFGC
jgi:hypothetical protein